MSFSSGIEKSVVLPVVIGVAAGELDHLGAERPVGDRVDRPGRGVDLVEGPRLGQTGGRGRDRVEARLHRRGHVGRLLGQADRLADQVDVLEHARGGRGVDDEDRDADLAELGDGVGRVEGVAAGDDEVGLEADDLLDVDRGEAGDVREGDGFGRVVVEVGRGDDARSRRRARTGSRSLAGVSETIFCGSALSVTDVPSSSVRVAGNAGAGVGLGVGAGVGGRRGGRGRDDRDGRRVGATEAAAAGAGGEDEKQGGEQGAEAGCRIDGGDGDGDTGREPPRLMSGVGGVAPRRETPRFERVEGGV